MQRRMIPGHAALLLLRDVAVVLESAIAPRIAATDDIQQAADIALQSVVDGHDAKNWRELAIDVKSELARRWFDLAGECTSFGEAGMLSLPWGTSDRVARATLLTQMMRSPPVSSLAA
jgi:hypothetical protein